jgi:hypothetical protein
MVVIQRDEILCKPQYAEFNPKFADQKSAGKYKINCKTL